MNIGCFCSDRIEIVYMGLNFYDFNIMGLKIV